MQSFAQLYDRLKSSFRSVESMVLHIYATSDIKFRDVGFRPLNTDSDGAFLLTKHPSLENDRKV